MIIVSISKQRLYHRRATGVWHSYPVSTAAAGPGNLRNSYATPLGRHRIHAKIGEGEHPLTVFHHRKPSGLLPPDAHPDDDWIVGRILWLEGMQTGINRRGRVDTRRRCIYIHGTHDVAALGQARSHGCIRMHPRDMLELFDQVRLGEHVFIRR